MWGTPAGGAYCLLGSQKVCLVDGHYTENPKIGMNDILGPVLRQSQHGIVKS